MRQYLRSLFCPVTRTIRRDQRKVSRRRPQLAIEQLEERRLMTAGLNVSFDLADRLLRIHGTDAADQIQIVNNAGQISVIDNSIRVIDGDNAYDVDSLAVGEISQAQVFGLSNDDVLDVVEQDVTPEMALTLVNMGGALADVPPEAAAEAALEPNTEETPLESVVSSQAALLDKQLGLLTDGNLWENWGGQGDKWLQGAAGKWYFLLPDGAMYAWDGSNTASGALVAQLDEAHYLDPALLSDAYQPVAERAARLDEQLGLWTDGNLWENWGGQDEKWLQGAAGEWYYILPTGALHAWDGSNTASGAFMAQLDEAYYLDPALLYDAYQPVAERAARLDEQLGLWTDGNLWENWGGQDEKWLQGAAGEWYYILPTGALHAWDGSNTASGAFVAQLDEAHYVNPALLSDAYQPVAERAARLDEQLGLWTDGNLWENWGGQDEKWLQGAAGEWYYILPTGALHAWDGSNTASGAFVAQLDEAHYLDPALLYDAYQPVAEQAAVVVEEVIADEVVIEEIPTGEPAPAVFNTNEELDMVFTTLDLTMPVPTTATLGSLSFDALAPSYTAQSTNLLLDLGTVSVFSAVDARYKSLGGATGFLGLPTSSQQTTADGVKFRHYQGGSIYWTLDSGAFVVRGALRDKYVSMGADWIALGRPTADSVEVRTGVWMSEFQHGNIYWSEATGAHEVHGLIAAHYKLGGGPNGALGLPTSDELPMGTNGRYNTFQNGAMYWTPESGVRMVYGAIGAKYLSLGGPTSFLGLAVTNELTAADGVGKFTHFQNGSIYWSPATGAHVIYGAIKNKWDSMGRQASLLGYPTSDEYALSNGDRISNFEGGSIVWNAPAGAHLSFDRNEMIRLLGRVGRDGVVTANELNTLRAWVSDANVWMPEYVRNLTIKNVFGNLANATVLGQNVGDLYAGSSGWQLQMLVDKWFLGKDPPVPQGTDGTMYGYAFAAGSLFGPGGPQLMDVDQSQVGDCYFLAALGAVVLREPQLIRDMFIDNGDGTFTVRFFPIGRPEYVTVNLQLPINSMNILQFAQVGGTINNASNVLWAALAEKAYVQLNQSGLTAQDGNNNYQGIAAGEPWVALAQITGRNGAEASTVGLASMVEAAMAGRMIVLSSNSEADDISHPLVVARHAYTLVSVNGGFLLYNPWGTDANDGANDGFDDGYILLTAAELMLNFGSWHVC